MVVRIQISGEKRPKVKAAYKCLPAIMLDSVVKIKKKYYPQTLLEECIYEIKKINIQNLIDDNLEKKFMAVNLVVNLMIKHNLMMRNIMMNLMNSLLKANKIL